MSVSCIPQHILGMSGAYHGHILGIPWHILGISQAFLGRIFGISWAYIRHILGISGAYLGHFMGIFEISWAILVVKIVVKIVVIESSI